MQKKITPIASLSDGLFRKRDFLILVIMGLAIFLSLDSPGFNFTLEPSWYIDQKFKVMLPPVICDLNGDGKKEVVLISKDADDLILKLVSAVPPNKDKGNIYSPQVVASVSLSPLKVSKGRHPVALKTGYVDQYDISKSRSQVIVVVREDWTVTCFDSSLHPLWEKAIAHKTHELDKLKDKFEIDEVSVFLTPLSIRDDLGGLVIVGANMKLRVSILEGKSDETELHEKAALEHFSIYALDAKTGHVVWRHDGLDVRPGQYITGLPQFAYKLDMHDIMTQSHHAPTVTDWTVFRQSLIAELPHDWHSTDDTSLRLAHFERKHIGAGGNKDRKHKSKISPVTISKEKKDTKIQLGKRNTLRKILRNNISYISVYSVVSQNHFYLLLVAAIIILYVYTHYFSIFIV